MKVTDRFTEILLADDDADDRAFFKEALIDAGIPSNLTTVNDGEKLTDYLHDIKNPPPPDVIFLDINMPCKDGKTCLREIRSDDKFRDVPIIMFSTSSYAGDIDETYRIGANLYLLKADFFENDASILQNLFAKNWTKNMAKVPKEQFVYKH